MSTQKFTEKTVRRDSTNILQFVFFLFLFNTEFVSRMRGTPESGEGHGISLRSHRFYSTKRWKWNEEKLGGGFKYVLFYFHPVPLENDPIWLIFFRWVVQPPTRKILPPIWWKHLLQVTCFWGNHSKLQVLSPTTCKMITPLKANGWIPKMMVWKMYVLFEYGIFWYPC